MNQSFVEQLDENCAKVGQICHIGYMALTGDVTDTLEERIEEFRDAPDFSEVLGLSEEEQGWLKEVSDVNEQIQIQIPNHH